MKKYLISLFLVFPLFAFAQTFDKDLYFSIQKDSNVTKLQEFLTDQKVYSGPISGNFFSLTLSAVKLFQTQQGISPASGYFGPKTRGKANQILVAEGVSSTDVVDESGSTTPVAIIPPKTTNDVVASLAAQIQLLQQQLNALQQQSQTLQTATPQIKVKEEQVVTLTNALGISHIFDDPIINKQRILDLISVGFVVTKGKLPEGIIAKPTVESQASTSTPATPKNTTPSPAPVPVPVPTPAPVLPVVKELIINASGCGGSGSCGVEVLYKEDGEKKAAMITVSANDSGIFTACDCNPLGESSTPNVQGNPLTRRTYRGGYGYQAGYFTYLPDGTGAEQFTFSPEDQGLRITRTITATANGLTATRTFTTRWYPAPKPDLNPILLILGTSTIVEGTATDTIPKNYLRANLARFKITSIDNLILHFVRFDLDGRDAYDPANSAVLSELLLQNENGNWMNLGSLLMQDHFAEVSPGQTLRLSIHLREAAKVPSGQHILVIKEIEAISQAGGNFVSVGRDQLPLTIIFKVQ